MSEIIRKKIYAKNLLISIFESNFPQMKKIYFLLLAMCFYTAVNAQIVNIPDAYFKAKLLAASSSNTTAKDLAGNYFKIDANSDGQIQVSEALLVKQLNLISAAISSLDGITSFTNIQILNCQSNLFSSLDVSVLTNLQTLNCGNTQYLSSLNVSGLTNLQTLNCSRAYALPLLNVSGLTNLQTLVCDNNKLKALDVSGLTNLQTLNCSFNLLPTINILGLTNLQSFNCSNSQLTSLDVTGLTNLQNLSCNQNLLTSLDASSLINLKTLYCDFNQLTTLNVNGLANLQDLVCDDNQLSSLDLTGLINLLTIRSQGNLLTSLNFNGLSNLETIVVSFNKLSVFNLTGLSSKLKYLDCDGNHINNLNLSGLNNLLSLNISYNNISNIDVSQLTKLESFYCAGNQLSDIDLSGLNNLLVFWCNSNQLTSLDLSGLNNLYELWCQDNKLISLFIKNGIKENFQIENNPNLKYICVDNSQLTDVQNIINGLGYINCSVNTYCSFVPGGTFYTIQGNQKFDSNANGCDALDIVVPNLKFSITDGVTTGNFISNSTGNYSIPVQVGTHTITPVLENPTYFNVSPTTVSVTFPAQTSPFVQDYCISANGVHPDLEVDLLPLRPAVPGFDAKYKLVYKNKGNQTQSGSINLAFDNAVLDLVVANPVAKNQILNNLSWDFTNLLPFETREITVTLNVNSPLETPAVNSGSVLPFIASISSATTDETPIDNTFSLNQTVVNSFDPNDKTCLEGSKISPNLIGQYVNYMIRFENNGTANALNIVVKDMIDLSKFDISTLVPTSASHSYITKISAGNKVEFIFENINLPFDDVNNDGYVSFKIKTLPTLVDGDTFANEANIYFDYNFPILTNKESSTFQVILATPDFEFSSYFTLYPNPAQSILNISSKETIEVKSISIYNTLGQLVLVVTNADKISKIDVSNLKTGNYFIKINSDKGTSNTKFIKE